MAFPSINDFKSRLLDGGARPSMFQMFIEPPFSLADRGFVDTLSFQCRVSEIPGTSVNPIIVKYAGREIKYAGQRTFTNLSVTILNDEAFTVRDRIEWWFELINSRENNDAATLTSHAGSMASSYGSTATVKQYSKLGGEPIKQYRFIDIFPVTMAAIPLDWSNDAAIEEYTVEFAYQYWEPV